MKIFSRPSGASVVRAYSVFLERDVFYAYIV